MIISSEPVKRIRWAIWAIQDFNKDTLRIKLPRASFAPIKYSKDALYTFVSEASLYGKAPINPKLVLTLIPKWDRIFKAALRRVGQEQNRMITRTDRLDRVIESLQNPNKKGVVEKAIKILQMEIPDFEFRSIDLLISQALFRRRELGTYFFGKDTFNSNSGLRDWETNLELVFSRKALEKFAKALEGIPLGEKEISVKKI